MKKNNAKILIGICVGMLLLVGASYAWFTTTLRSEKTTVIRAGDLSLNLDESTSDGILVNPAKPLTQQEGLGETNPAYTFTLKNDGTLANAYTIYLDDITTGEKKISDTVLNYDLKKTEYNAEKTIKTPQTDTMKLLSSIKDDNDYILDTGVLEPNEYNEYSFKIWMDYNAGNEYQNSKYSGQLRIVGNQISK